MSKHTPANPVLTPAQGAQIKARMGAHVTPPRTVLAAMRKASNMRKASK